MNVRVVRGTLADCIIYKYILQYTFSSHLLTSPFSPSLVATQIRGHIAGSSLPLPTTVRALHFYREKISALSSLVDSRRIVLIHARRSFYMSANKFKISPRRDSNSRTNASSIRGLPLIHRGDRSFVWSVGRLRLRRFSFFLSFGSRTYDISLYFL